MSRRLFLTAIVLSMLELPAGIAAQEWEALSVEAPAQAVAAASPNCSLGVKYDDGGFEFGYSLGSDAGTVMRFDLPGGTNGLEQVCVCFSRGATGPTSVHYQVVVYNNDGPGNGPGTLLGTVPATANSLTTSPKFYTVDLTSSGIHLPDQSVFVGVLWPGGTPANVFVCGDTSGTTTQRTNYGSGNGGASWTSMNTLFPSNPPRAMGIRVDPLTLVSGPCIPSATAMCLNNNRFKVEATFRTVSTPSAPAQVVKLTDDTGYFWFFASTNVEVVVKVLNACSFPSSPRYWVFAAGLTNVEVVLKVTDTQTGSVRTYTNPLNRPYPPLQDTSAFATCP